MNVHALFTRPKPMVNNQSLQQVALRPTEHRLLLKGIDSLYVAFYLDTATSRVDWDELAFLKERTGRDRGAEFSEIELGSETFALKPYGKHPYSYVLRNRDFEVRLSEGLSPSCYVQFFSEALWTQSPKKLFTRFRAWCDSMNLRRIRPESVSRADWAFDYHLPVIDFDPSHFVSRATKRATWHEHEAVQTVQFGQGATVVRVYDKVAEIEQKSDKAWFFELWGQRSNVWRIEFQVRAERLKQGGIRTFENLLEFETDLLRELATVHTSLRFPNGDSNRSRWPVHRLWRQLLEDVLRGTEHGLVRSYDEKAGLEWRLDRNIRSLAGYTKNIAALMKHLHGMPQPPNLDETMEEITAMVRDVVSEQLWHGDVAKRCKEIELGE